MPKTATQTPTIAIPAGTKSVLCRGQTCGARIYFVLNPKTGRVTPVSVDGEGCRRPSESKDADQGDVFAGAAQVYDGVGISHFTDCPDADSFSKGAH